jgi:hypothetical protein
MDSTNNRARYALAFTVVLGGIGLLLCMIFFPVPLESKDILNVGLGLVLGWGAIIMNFEFGAARKAPRQEVTVANSTSDPVPVEPA